MDEKSGDNMECAAARSASIPLSELDDEELVYMAREGDEEALEVLIKREPIFWLGLTARILFKKA